MDIIVEVFLGLRLITKVVLSILVINLSISSFLAFFIRKISQTSLIALSLSKTISRLLLLYGIYLMGNVVYFDLISFSMLDQSAAERAKYYSRIISKCDVHTVISIVFYIPLGSGLLYSFFGMLSILTLNRCSKYGHPDLKPKLFKSMRRDIIFSDFLNISFGVFLVFSCWYIVSELLNVKKLVSRYDETENIIISIHEIGGPYIYLIIVFIALLILNLYILRKFTASYLRKQGEKAGWKLKIVYE